MKFVKLFTLSALVMSSAGCSHSTPPLSSQLTKVEHSQLEIVYNFTHKSDRVSFVVESYGCTMAEHFELKQSVNAEGKLELALLRLKKDRCRAMPRAFPVNFKLATPWTSKQDIELLNEIETERKLPRKAMRNSNRS